MERLSSQMTAGRTCLRNETLRWRTASSYLSGGHPHRGNGDVDVTDNFVTGQLCDKDNSVTGPKDNFVTAPYSPLSWFKRIFYVAVSLDSDILVFLRFVFFNLQVIYFAINYLLKQICSISIQSCVSIMQTSEWVWGGKDKEEKEKDTWRSMS